MSLVSTVRDLTQEMEFCEGHEEALGVLNIIASTLETSPIALGFWYLWPPELYKAYLDAMRVYAWTCMERRKN